MILHAVTDRRNLGGDLLDFIARALAAGVDVLQIREKDLSALELLDLCRAARALPNPHGAKLLVNTRADIALAAELDGVHLPAHALPPDRLRQIAPADFRIGISCHTLDALHRAESEGADYAFYSPIFPTPSKPGYGPPLGLGQLARACAAVSLPVVALGGVTVQNAAPCRQAGAAGIASISLFQKTRTLAPLIAELRQGTP